VSLLVTGLGVMARSVCREEDAEYWVVRELGDWVRMILTSLSQLVDGGEGGLGCVFKYFRSGHLSSSLPDFFLFLFFPSSSMSSSGSASHVVTVSGVARVSS